MNLTTCILIIFGGLGFLVILDILKQKRFRKLTLHSKVVIVTSLVLLVAGTVILKLTENVTWLGGVLSKCFSKNSRIFHIPDWRVYKRRFVCIVYFDVYRCFSRIYRWRYQDEYIFHYVPEDKRNMHKGNGACVSPKHIRAEYYKGVYDYDSFRNGCMYRNIFHVCTGTGI